MTYSHDLESTKSKLETFKNGILIYIVAGTVVMFISLYITTDGFDEFGEEGWPFFFWTIVIVIAILFFLRARGFVTNPESKKLPFLKTLFYIFTISWLIAIPANLVLGGIDISTLIGALLAIAASGLMNQFLANGRYFLEIQSSPQLRRTITPPSVAQPQSMDRISQLERLSSLREKGAITEEEYQKEKDKIIK